MKDLGEIIRVGLPNARTRHDVVELCKQTLFDLEAASFDRKLFIRYMQPMHMDTCMGPIDGITLAYDGPLEPRIAVGVAFIDPDDVHPTEGLRGIYAGGAVCHPGTCSKRDVDQIVVALRAAAVSSGLTQSNLDAVIAALYAQRMPADPWSKDLGKMVAVLRAQFIPGDIAANMAIRMSPWDHSLPMSKKTLRTLQLKYPWSVMRVHDKAFPALARPAVVDAIRYAIRYCLGGSCAFGVTATSAQRITSYVPAWPLVDELIDAACTLPSHVALTPDERAEKERAGRAVAAMARRQRRAERALRRSEGRR